MLPNPTYVFLIAILFLFTISRSILILAPPKHDPPVYKNPCVPNPCGLYATCQSNGDRYSCSCLPSYLGSPPNCLPECTINSQCASNLACIKELCVNPCPGSCGFNAECKVLNHIPNCHCIEGYIGDPFNSCSPKPRKKVMANLILRIISY